MTHLPALVFVRMELYSNLYSQIEKLCISGNAKLRTYTHEKICTPRLIVRNDLIALTLCNCTHAACLVLVPERIQLYSYSWHCTHNVVLILTARETTLVLIVMALYSHCKSGTHIHNQRHNTYSYSGAQIIHEYSWQCTHTTCLTPLLNKTQVHQYIQTELKRLNTCSH